MAETYRIDIEFRPDSDKKLIIPETIRVPQNSVIEWSIKELDEISYNKTYYRTGLIFTVYFNKKSPFDWKKESLRIYGDPLFPPFYPFRQVKLAEGVAEIKGSYKYGVKVAEPGNSEPIYDEDPTIIVY